MYNKRMSKEMTAPRRVNLLKSLGRGFKCAYDHLGYVVFVTLASFVLTAMVLSLTMVVKGKTVPFAATVFVAVLVSWMCAVGAFYYANRAVYYEHPGILDTLTGIRVLALPALKLFLIDILVLAVLVCDAVFFLGLAISNKSLLFAMPGVLFGYGALIWMMMAMYHLPLLPAQLDMDSGTGPWVIIKKSFLLMAGSPGFTVGLFLVIIAFAVICALPVLIGTAIIFMGAAAFVLTHALRELFIKYGVVEEEPEVIDDSWPNVDDKANSEGTTAH
ncbi:MAG: hypothetical protein ABFD54_10760 [Armatimonadota bacterium]|nr:hypothetical protein [bacterium]